MSNLTAFVYVTHALCVYGYAAESWRAKCKGKLFEIVKMCDKIRFDVKAQNIVVKI